MYSSNLLSSPRSEVSASFLYRQQLTELLRRITSVACLIILDSTGMTVAAFGAAVLLGELQKWDELFSLLPVAIVFLLLVMNALHLYKQLPYRRRYDLVFLGFSMPWLTSLLASRYYSSLNSIDSLLLLGWSIGLPLVLVGRQLYDTFTYNWRRSGWTRTAALFVGDAEAEAQLKIAFPSLLPEWQIVGRISPVASWHDPGALGTLEDLPLLLEKCSVRCLILTASGLGSQLFQTVVQYCDDAGVKLLVLQPPLSARKRLGIFSSAVWSRALVLVVRESWSYTVQSLCKRAIDFVAAGLGIILLSPLMLVIALLIRLDTPGSIFFRQQRLGRGGKAFLVWKFRTMVVNAEQLIEQLERLNESAGGVLFKMKEDPRVTRVGKFLRRTSLDELPQLFNVLQGHMSLVGPRPLQLRDCELAIAAYPDVFAKRLTVMPGITGLWQVSGRSQIAFDDMLHLDIHYIDRWSLWLDLHIIWQTIQVVLTSKGAY